MSYTFTMGFSNLIMDHRGGSRFIKPSSTASSKYLPSSSSSRPSFRPKNNLPLNLKHSTKTSPSRTQSNLLNISRPVKSHKMSTSNSAPSKKRTRDEEPFGSSTIGEGSPELKELLDVPPKRLCLSITKSEEKGYLCRQKVMKYAAMVRQKRALVSLSSNGPSIA